MLEVDSQAFPGVSLATTVDTSSLRKIWEEEPEELHEALQTVERLCSADSTVRIRRCLEFLTQQLQPGQLSIALRERFVCMAVDLGLVPALVEILRHFAVPEATEALRVLNNISLGAIGCQAVLDSLQDVAHCFAHRFQHINESTTELVGAGIMLTANLAAVCSDRRLLCMVRHLILEALRRQEHLAAMALLSANLASTLASELRELGVAEALLDAVARDVPGRSVAESVVVYLQDGRECSEVDALIKMGLVPNYCVPLMQATLCGTEFRGMYPFRMYTSRLFLLLSKCRAYAEALAEDDRALSLLLQACQRESVQGFDSTVLEGRVLALRSIGHLTSFGLWPGTPAEAEILPCLSDGSSAVRAAASALWARLHKEDVWGLLLVAARMDRAMAVPPVFWREQILSYLYPSLSTLDI